MSTFLQLFLRSLETGSIYALAALGIIVIYRTSNVINFSQGVMGMFNTYAAATFFNKFGFPVVLSIVCGLIFAVFIGFLVDFVVIRRTKKVAGVGKEIITLGLMMVFLGAAPICFGVDTMRMAKIINDGAINIGGASISYNGLLNILLGALLTAILFTMLQKTKLGLAIRTTSSNERTARLMGVPTPRVTLFAWALAAILSCLAGVLIAPSTQVSTGVMDNVQMNALIACVLGGFQTFYGPVVGAYIIGIMKNLLVYYVSSVWGEQIMYLLIIVFVILKPVGIFGKKTIKKV